MKLAFCLFKYFPYGGLQRDFLRIARLCQQKGHEVHVYTTQWEGETEPGLQLHLLPVKGLQNHQRMHHFAAKIKAELGKTHYDLVIGFNKMPFLDLYYAADVCYQARAKSRHFFYRLLPRYHRFCALEKAVFATGNKTEIIVISPHQQTEYIKHYQTENSRFHLLPPGIDKARLTNSDNENKLDKQNKRELLRKKYGLAHDDLLLLAIGSGFKTKGLDRTILALSSLPETLKKRCHLFVIGQDKPTPFQKLADKLQIAEQVHFLGGRDDVPALLLAGDLLIHPAYHENTGTVLLEAIVSGLAVLTVDVCGYAHYVRDANAGIVLSSPFQQDHLNRTLQMMLLSDREKWQENALTFAKHADIYRLPEKVYELIEHVGQKSVFVS